MDHPAGAHEAERVRVLLESVIALGADLDREAVLPRIVAAACAVSRAGSGTLEVQEGPGRPAEVVGPGELPSLPPLAPVPEPGPVLELPVLVDGDVYGVLRLAEREGGDDFDEVDARMVRAVLAMAAHVLGNVAGHAESEQRRAWVGAGVEAVEALESAAPVDEVLSVVVTSLRRAAGATAAAVIVPDEDGVAEVRAADVQRDARAEARDLVGEVAPRLTEAAAGHGPTTLHEGGGLVVALPLRPRLADPSVLVVWFRERTDDVPDEDLAVYRVLADHATMALDRARAAAEHEQLLLMTDRDRIARDLHDLVIQRIFATGLQLRVLGRSDDLSAVRAGIDAAVGDLDETIRDIRSTIFELQHSRTPSLRADVRTLAREYAGPLGFSPVVRTRGPVDSLVDRHVAEHLLATLRECLSNVVRHARASGCAIDVEATGSRVRLVVADDGVGLPPGEADPSGHGLGNMRARAVELGGELALDAVEPQGTRLVWHVPLGPR